MSDHTVYLYQPLPEEQGPFDELWKIANPTGIPTISGHSAVDFFCLFQLPIETMGQIWSLSTQDDDMDLDQFYTALRYITLVQKGVFPLDDETLEETMGIFFGFPRLQGIHYSGDLAGQPLTVERLEANDIEYQSAVAKIKEFDRIEADAEQKYAAMLKRVESQENKVAVLQSQIATASAGSNLNAPKNLPKIKEDLLSEKSLLIALKERCASTTAETNHIQAEAAEIRQYLEEHVESIPAKEERLKSLHHLKKQLDSDMLGLFTQIGNVSGIGQVDAVALCSSQGLLEDLKIYAELDHELRARVLTFVKRSKSDEEKELLKRAVVEAKLPLNTKDESLKFHLSISQRIQAVEIKIATNQVPSISIAKTPATTASMRRSASINTPLLGSQYDPSPPKSLLSPMHPTSSTNSTPPRYST